MILGIDIHFSLDNVLRDILLYVSIPYHSCEPLGRNLSGWAEEYEADGWVC